MFAKEFQIISKLPIANILFRKKKTLPQAQTTGRLERSYNIQNAFMVYEEVENSVKGKNVILIDDVITTGNTLKEAAKTLKEAGAKQVFAWCLAKD